jgi:hypothetical protein
MDNDLLPFLAGVGLLVIYLIFSALTEMGTNGRGGNDRIQDALAIDSLVNIMCQFNDFYMSF